MADLYKTFTRTWWRRDAQGRIVPGAGRPTTRERNLTEPEAQRFCKRWNDTHKPGVLSRKCEYTRQD